jgi:hypothetical protein
MPCGGCAGVWGCKGSLRLRSGQALGLRILIREVNRDATLWMTRVEEVIGAAEAVPFHGALRLALHGRIRPRLHLC